MANMKKNAEEVSNMLCSLGFVPELFCAEMRKDHRTIQQNITRFCIDWLNYLAEDWTQSTDARNEASIGIAKDLHKIEEAREVMHRPIPYI